MGEPIGYGDVEQSLVNIFQEVIGTESVADLKTLSQESCLRWDSMAHLLLLERISTHFGFVISFDDAIGMQSYIQIKKFVLWNLSSMDKN